MYKQMVDEEIANSIPVLLGISEQTGGAIMNDADFVGVFGRQGGITQQVLMRSRI